MTAAMLSALLTYTVEQANGDTSTETSGAAKSAESPPPPQACTVNDTLLARVLKEMMKTYPEPQPINVRKIISRCGGS